MVLFVFYFLSTMSRVLEAVSTGAKVVGAMKGGVMAAKKGHKIVKKGVQIAKHVIKGVGRAKKVAKTIHENQGTIKEEIKKHVMKPSKPRGKRH
mgnify:CR=1 FL=1